MIIPLHTATDHGYDADLSAVRLQFTARRKPLPDVFPRIELLDAYARILKAQPRKLQLLGSTSWAKPGDAPKRAILVRDADKQFGALTSATLADDMQALTVWYTRGKIHYAWCAHTPCGKPFEVRRGRSQSSRWAKTCSTTCRQALKRVTERKGV